MLHIPNLLIVSYLQYFSLSFFTAFATNALKTPINRLIFATNLAKNLI
jgi:hypothetical protein